MKVISETITWGVTTGAWFERIASMVVLGEKLRWVLRATQSG
jgi:hypothetical protein